MGGLIPSTSKRREEMREAEKVKEGEDTKYAGFSAPKKLGMGSNDTARLQISEATKLFKDERVQCKLCSFQTGN